MLSRDESLLRPRVRALRVFICLCVCTQREYQQGEWRNDGGKTDMEADSIRTYFIEKQEIKSNTFCRSDKRIFAVWIPYAKVFKDYLYCRSAGVGVLLWCIRGETPMINHHEVFPS
jgi:hypothetical protein